jgi:hypothetical protein
MLRKRVIHIQYIRRKYEVVHTIVVKVAVPQPEMTRFTITVDVASMTLRPSCWRRSDDLLRLKNAHDFIHNVQNVMTSSFILLEFNEDIVCQESANKLV